MQQEAVGILVQERDREIFEDLFKKPPTPELFQKLSQENQEWCFDTGLPDVYRQTLIDFPNSRQ